MSALKLAGKLALLCLAADIALTVVRDLAKSPAPSLILAALIGAFCAWIWLRNRRESMAGEQALIAHEKARGLDR